MRAGLRASVRAVVVMVVASLVLAGAPLGTGRAAPAGWRTWSGTATGAARTAVLDAGEWIYTDAIFEDPGANADGLNEPDYFSFLLADPRLPVEERDDVYRALTWNAFGMQRSATDGDYRLPTDRSRWPDFTGEVAEVRLAADATTLHVRLLFTSMPRADAQIATLAFTMQGAEPAARNWPRNAGVASPWSTALTLWGGGGEVADADATTDLATAGGAVRAGGHVLEAQVPLALLPPGPWVLRGGAGLADPADTGRYWSVPPGEPSADRPGSGADTAPGANVWNLLFADDEAWVWDERVPADLLAGGDVSAASARVDPAALAAGVSQPAPARTGHVRRWYSSRLDEGDGIRRGAPGDVPSEVWALAPPRLRLRDPGVPYLYTGRLQRYDLYVPSRYSGSKAAPLIVYLHGLNNFVNEPFGNVLGLAERLEAGGYLFASVLGRGDQFYRGAGELDVLEVVADVARHHRVDPDRVYLMGHSMGGYGSHNVATRHPDLFAAVAPAQGQDSVELLANLRHVPWLMMSSVEDLDAGGLQGTDFYETLSALGYDATLLHYTRKTHEYSSIYDSLDAIFSLFGRSTREADPATVTYVRPADDDARLGLVHDGAYWLSGLALADASRNGRADATSFAIPHQPLQPDEATRTRTLADTGGPSGRSEHVRHSTEPAFDDPVDTANRAELALSNVSAASLDLDRMRLLADGLRLDVSLEVDTTVALARAAAGTYAVEIDGAHAGELTADGGELTLPLPAATDTVLLRLVTAATAGPPPAAGPTPAEPVAARDLPATGPTAALTAVVLLALAGAAAACARRRPIS